MRAIDTETTGLNWQHETTVFAIGMYNGETFEETKRHIHPLTRKRVTEFTPQEKAKVQAYFNEPVFLHNANFDTKALCEAGVFDWDEPAHPEFWKNVHELGHLIHLHDSRDAEFGAKLKVLTPKYLNRDFKSQEVLMRVVNRCRTFIKNRSSKWLTGSPETCPQVVKDFNKTDMWLPGALLEYYPGKTELKKYFREDFDILGTVVSDYLRDDCESTLELALGFLTNLLKTGEPNEDLLRMNRDILHVVWKMETLGTPLKSKEAKNAIDVCSEWIDRTHENCKRLSGRDVQTFTDDVLRDLLFKEYKLTPVIMTKGGQDGKNKQPSVNAKAILKLKDQCVEHGLTAGNDFLTNLLVHRKYDKKRQALQRYCRGVQTPSALQYHPSNSKGTYVFPWFKSSGTATTRFSSDFQNIEKANDPFSDEYPDVAEMLAQSPMVRSVFGPDEGDWWSAFDYSQLQLRIFAAATKDSALIQAFDDGWDFHDFMTHVVFDMPPDQKATEAQRRIGKNVNFGFIFGASEKKIDATAGRPGLYGYLMKSFPGAHAFLTETKEKIQETGTVHTFGGYPLRIPIRMSPWGTRSYAAHMGVNYIVQGTEGEIVKRAMRDTDKYLTEQYSCARILLQIHDELVFCHPANPPKYHLRNLRNLMTQAGAAFGVKTPVDGDLILNSLNKKISLKFKELHERSHFKASIQVS